MADESDRRVVAHRVQVVGNPGQRRGVKRGVPPHARGAPSAPSEHFAGNFLGGKRAKHVSDAAAGLEPVEHFGACFRGQGLGIWKSRP